MDKARVLVIDGDDWVARLLADGLRDHGFDVSTCLSGGDALAVAGTIAPDCVISEMVLPELDGPSIARAIRSEKAPLANVPIMFLSNVDDVASRRAAFGAGADVYLTKPFRVDEVAMQVQGLVAMAGRLTGAVRAPQPSLTGEPDSAPESLMPGGHAIEGNIAQMSVATVLTLLEMERRSGVLKVSSGPRKCVLEIVAGYAVGGAIDDSKVAPLAVLRDILRWQDGRFQFRPGSDGAVPSNRRSIGALLIEAVRLDDESSRDNWPEEGPTARRSWPVIQPGGAKRATASALRRASRPPPPGRPSRPPPPMPGPKPGPAAPGPKPGPAAPGAKPGPAAPGAKPAPAAPGAKPAPPTGAKPPSATAPKSAPADGSKTAPRPPTKGAPRPAASRRARPAAPPPSIRKKS
jgi:two-component system, OmpR family, response regulator